MQYLIIGLLVGWPLVSVAVAIAVGGCFHRAELRAAFERAAVRRAGVPDTKALAS